MGSLVQASGTSKPYGNDVITDASAMISIRTTHGCVVASVALEDGETVETFIARVTTVLNVMFEREPAPEPRCATCGAATRQSYYYPDTKKREFLCWDHRPESCR